MKRIYHTGPNITSRNRAVLSGGSFCFPCLMEMRMTRTRMEKTGKRIQPLTDRELQGKVGKRFFSDGKAGPFGFRGKIILAALRYFSRKPCLSGSVYRKALVVQRAAKARIFTIKIIKSRTKQSSQDRRWHRCRCRCPQQEEKGQWSRIP